MTKAIIRRSDDRVRPNPYATRAHGPHELVAGFDGAPLAPGSGTSQCPAAGTLIGTFSAIIGRGLAEPLGGFADRSLRSA